MREIIFRGKRKSDGKWWEGYLTVVFQHTYIEKANENEAFRFVVDPETVGQFTGLTDKNGKRIFEGDILKRTNGNKYVWYVDYKNCAFCANQSNCNYACELGELLDQIELEVIGNVHDNPELLEG